MRPTLEQIQLCARESSQEQLPEAVAAQAGLATLKPSSLKFLQRYYRLFSPRYVLEFGSGLSTRFQLDYLAPEGSFRLVTIDHSGYFLKLALGERAADPRVLAVHAPLAPAVYGGKWALTYSRRAIGDATAREPMAADLILIDGPQAFFGREFTLYLAQRWIGPGTVIVLDDSHRTGERQAIAAWLRCWSRLRPVSLGPDEPMTAFVFEGPSLELSNEPIFAWSLRERVRSFIRMNRRRVYLWTHRLKGNEYKL